MTAFLTPVTLCSFTRNSTIRKRGHFYPFTQNYATLLVTFQQVYRRGSVRMALDAGVVQGVLTAVLGLGAGIAFLIWTEKQGVRSAQRENVQACVVCNGQKRLECIRCQGSGKSPTDSSEMCSFCDGVGTVVCTNCAGRGVQPRYLDRYSPEDFLD